MLSSILPLGLDPFLHVPSAPASSRAARRPFRHVFLLGISLLVVASFVHPTRAKTLDKRASRFETGADGAQFIWTLQDTYAGETFFDRWVFFTGDDPTHGTVNYTDKNTAFAKNLAYVNPDGTVIMKGDNTTWLDPGVYRNSVRISSIPQYNTGLFILDLNKAPWGCGVWPAWWTLGNGQWPYLGEIDIIEGVHDNEHNQVAWHTGPNCTLNPNAKFTGSVVQGQGGQLNLVCDGNLPGNAGCGITEWSRASYGPTFDAQGGGVFAMKWDDTGISVWSFYRAAVPKDIQSGQPSPSTWNEPVAYLDPSGCDPLTNFVNHSMIFDITFCGDWAGNSYATSQCPGTCPDRLIDPSNFVNATWSINSLKVFKRQPISGQSSDGPPSLSVSNVVRLLPYTLSFLLLGLFRI